jgi:hypothetical protein
MKYIICVFQIIFTFSLGAQSERAYIRDHLRIHYVVNGNLPNTAGNVTVLNNSEIYAHQFNGTFWTTPALAGSQGMVKALLCEASNGGDKSLQIWANRLLSVTGKTVFVYIIDDLTNPITDWDYSTGVIRRTYGACQGANGCWPCAMGYASDPNRDIDMPELRNVAGQLAMGNYYFSRAEDGGSVGLNTFKKGVFLHELTHTQDNANSRSHIFWLADGYYNYGRDGTHYYAEVLPNLAAGFKEALANFSQMGYNRYGAYSPYTFAYRTFETNGGLDIEAPPTTGQGSTGDIGFANELLRLRIPYQKVKYGTVLYYRFKYRDLPIKYVIRNEMIMGMIFYNCRYHMGAQTFWRAIMSSNSQLFRVSSWPVDITFLELCRAAVPPGVPETETGLGVSRSGGNPYLFPLALCDFFTDFRATSAADFGTIFENPKLLQPFINTYWVMRPTVRAAVGTSRSDSAIASIKSALGFN